MYDEVVPMSFRCCLPKCYDWVWTPFHKLHTLTVKSWSCISHCWSYVYAITILLLLVECKALWGEPWWLYMATDMHTCHSCYSYNALVRAFVYVILIWVVVVLIAPVMWSICMRWSWYTVLHYKCYWSLQSMLSH